MNEFEKLGIIQPILKVIEEEGFEKPSDIQTQAIPIAVQGKDVIGWSATGSGKTLVFGSAIIQECKHGAGLQSLILVPTRELAVQVAEALMKFSKYKNLRFCMVYGGVSINPQIEELRKCEVAIGTPGRILDHLDRQTLDLRQVKILVLDEADRMLDMGFVDDVKKIMHRCVNPARQTMLFSATISDDITELAKRYMKNPAEVNCTQYVDPSMLKQYYYDVPQNLKLSLLVHLLKAEKAGLAMVFCNSRDTVDFVVNNLKFSGVDAIAIHGGFSQDKREKTMKQFHSQNFSVLVCTDVAARGLDIQGVTHIYNFDLPGDNKSYIHRIGRTARAGAKGKAINILAERDHENFRRILRDSSLNVELLDTPFLQRLKVSMARDPDRIDRHGPPRSHTRPRTGMRGPGQSRDFRGGRGRPGQRGGGRGGFRRRERR